MELIGGLNKKDHKVRIEQEDEGIFTIDIEDRSYRVSCLELMPNLYSILHEDDSYEVRVHNGKKGFVDAHFDQFSFHVEMTDPMKRLLEESTGGGHKGELALEAPMPGQVQRILVKEGDEVEEDQGLLVLVAMKMENELGSPKKGKVKEVHVKEGDTVDGGTSLVIVA